MIDLTTKVGGRTVAPALPIVDGSNPTPTELSFQTSLTAYISQNVPLESEEGIRTRERVLVKMGQLHREWVKSVATKKGLNKDAVDSAGGELFTSGSYRLGVHEPGADIGEQWIVVFKCLLLLLCFYLCAECRLCIFSALTIASSALNLFRHHRRGSQYMHT